MFSRPLKGFMELTGYTREKANTTPAVYDPDLNRIYVNEEWATIMPLSDVHTLLLHELMHAATEMPFQKHGENKILNAAEKEFVDTITALYSLTKSKIKKEIYGLKSNSEFVSEVMTNPSFRSEINKADKSIWRRIMNAIRKFFGLTPKNSKIITRAETAVKNFIDKSKEFTPSEKLEIYNKRGYIHAAPINTEDNNVLNRFNEEEIEEITDAMIYIIMDSAGIENIRDFKSLSSEHKDRVDISSGSPYFFGPVNDWLLDHVEDLEEQGFEEEANKINYAMEPLIFDALYKEAQLKLKQYYGVILNEEDELETRDSGNITKDAVEINWKDNASTNTKLLIAFNPKVDINDNQIYSKHFKLPAFNNFTGTWNLLQSQLADIVSEEAEEDVVKAMAKKIEQIVPIAPSLRRIQYFLEDPNTPEQKKTQFASAFALSKINYTTTLHSITDSGIKIYKIGNSENMGKVSNEQILLNSWEQNLVTKIVDSDINNYNKASVNAEKALDLVAQYRALESAFRKVIRKHKALDDTITDTFIESINTLLQNTGITIDPRALYLLKDEYIDEKRSIEEDNYFFIKDVIQNILGRVYVQTKLGYSINNLILKGEEGLEKNYGIVKTAITNDKELLKLAKYGIMFTDLYSENMVQGAKGNKYWAYSKYHYISKFLAEAKQDPNMLKELAEMPFYQHSELLQYLLAGEETTLLHWNQFKEEFSDHLGDSFSDIKKVDDMADRMNRILKGFYPYINAADKSRHYNIKGPKVLSSGVTYNEEVGYNIENSEGIRRITGHVIDEIANSYVAYEQIKGELTLGAKNTIPRREHVLHFHYKLAKDGITKVYSNKIQANGELFDKDLPEGFPVGNWTKLSTLPSLSYGTPLARRLGLYKSTGQPFSPSPDMYERIDEYVGEALLENINEQVETAKGMGVFRQISTSTMTQDYGYVENIIKTNEEGEAVGDITQEDISSHESHNNAAFHNAHADIVFNSIYMNLEMTKLFIGDTRFYKNPGDLKKRTPGGIGTGTDMRIYKDSKGEYVVKPTYTQATGRDVIKGSDFFTKENIPLIANALAIGDKTIEEATKEAKKLVEGYSEGIDIADAQAWITMDRAIEIFRGTGTFTKEHEANLDKIKKGTANYKFMEIFFQPIKGMHYELRRANGMAVPTYLKYSQSILHPALTAGNDLDNLRTAMEDQGVDEFTVVQGIKVGATDIADWVNADSSIKKDIILNPVTLQNKYWKLQQELTPHGLTQSLVGSQVKKNIIANIDLDTIYEIEGRTISGRDLVQELHDIDIQLSDEGAIFISDKLGYDMGTDTYYDQSLLREYLLKNMEDMPRAMRDAVATGLPFDAFPQFVESISSKLTNAVTKKTVKLKQLGGSYIQQSPVGFFGNNKVPDFIKDNLVMIDKKSKKIKGPRVVGETIAAGQVLLPHQVLDELKEKFPELTTDELLLKIDKKMLEGIGYRIPNQANSSNEAINIAGFLPSFMGDTVVVYEEITTKTGSDFDIDKMFILLPNYRVSKKKGATKIPFLEKDTVVEKDKQGNDIPPLVSRYLLKWGDYKRRNRIKTLFSEFEAEHADELTTLKEALIEIKGDEWYAKELAALRQISLEELQETEEEATMLELAELLNDGKDIPHKFLNKSKASIEEQKKNITSIFNVLIKGYYKAKRFAEEDLQKLRIAIEEMAMNKAVEEGYIPSMETFESLPINKQNTIKALQNKRIELYRSILLHPSKFNEVMTPLDADDIADNIKSLIPSEGKKPDLYYYTMLSQLDDKHNFNGGKFGVGLTANQLVDAALSQAADIYMNISGLEDIANYNDDGTLSLAGQRDTKGRLISHIISGYLNAYVDIAKDEYIIKGNHNILTANTVFMLLRAGVPFEWVNAFINQPILRDYVKLSQKSEGRTTDFLHVKNTLTSMYTEEGSEKETDWTSILEESPSKLLENLSEEDLSHTSNPEEYKGNKVDQLQVLNAFLYLRDKSKALSDSILTSKQDTIGAGRSLWDAYTMINRIEDVLETNEVGNFSNKFIRTALGQFTENSVGLANRMFKNLFVNSSVSFRDTVDSVSKLTTGKKVTKVEFAELVSRELYAGVMSDPYHLDKEEYNDLWFGKNHIAKQLMVMQKDPEFEENSLIKILKPRIRYKGNPSTIKFHNSKGTNPITDNMLIADWERLYFGSSELGKKFATNLMYVAYFQSGFKTRAGSFDHLIPPSIQVAEGIADSTMGVISDVKNNVNKLDTVVEQIFRHNSKNSELVPVLRNGFRKPPQMHKINAQVPIRYAFSVPIGSNPDLIIGADANNNFVHKPFVLRKVWDNAKEEMVEQFFEYYGNHSLQRYDKETGKEFNQNNAIYVRTHTLGVSNKGDIITEYDINSDKTSSNFPKNSITFGLNTKTSNPLLDQFKAAQNYVNNGIAKNGYIKAPGPVVSNNISITMDKPKIYTPSEQAVLDLIKKCK